MQRLPSFAVLAAVLSVTTTGRCEPLDYYLPPETEFDPDIPPPAASLGFDIGERHIAHAQLVDYVRQVAAASPRVTIEEYARSHGRRPLLLLTITSPENHQRIDEIARRHGQLARPNQAEAVDLEQLQAVINMGYGVHGDEPSASNAAPLVLYYLAAARGDRVERLLRDVVILLDPCLNPDGLNRFANWANDYSGRTLNSDPEHAEHRQAWPGGRVNYYWFDLNRDWLPVQHPESRGRVQTYHRWKPNVVLDFHEMGTDATYFFQPGVPRRRNPLIPAGNVDLTQRIAEHHAQALDALGSLYFTEERFDDFYPGKGSTYPDLHGGVGILFEQASSRGHVQDSAQGALTFAFTIRNQVGTSLSSLAATQALRTELLEHKRDFYREALREARVAETRTYAFTTGGDLPRLSAFADVLRGHDIRCFWLTEDFDSGNERLRGGETLIVPARQPEHRFLTALLERRTEFEENIFYDVSTWTLPLAFDLDQTELAVDIPEDLLTPRQEVATAFEPDDADYAYLIDWRSSQAAATLYELLDRDVRVRVATQPLATSHGDRQIVHPHGTLLVPLGIQESKRPLIRRILGRAAVRGVPIVSVRSGLTPVGIDLGSSDFRPLERPRVLMLIDGGVSRYAAGSIWHYLDTRVRMPVTLVPQDRVSSVNLSEYTTIILPDGSYGSLSAGTAERIGEWVSAGGTLIAQGSAIRWLKEGKLSDVAFRDETDDESRMEADASGDIPVQSPYAEADDERALDLISGAIFETVADPSHPIGYGLSNDSLPVFRNNRIFLAPSDNRYANPVMYTAEPLLSGYCSTENIEHVAGSAAVRINERGRGRIVLMTDEANFRGFWFGTERLMANAVFFGGIVRVP